MEKLDTKDFKVKDPLFWGMIWYSKWMTDAEKKKEGLKKYRFKRTNRAKKYHFYECKFWNNKLEVRITKDDIMFDCYNIDEENNTINYANTLFIGTRFSYEEIKWFVETMEDIHKAIKNKEKEVLIIGNEYEPKKVYSNGAYEFEKENDEQVSNIIFWDNEDGGNIQIAQGPKYAFNINLSVKIDGYDNEDIYMPLINDHLSVPVELMKEILKDMESIE